MWRRVGPLVCLAFVAAACSSDTKANISVSAKSTVPGKPTTSDTSLATQGAESSIEWGTCDDEDVADDRQCATIKLPLDYNEPDGTMIDVALVRIPATGDRKGAVLFNPGGPGGSGWEMIAVNGDYFASALGGEVTRSYDLVGFDPRGTDRSTPLRCLDDAFVDAHLYVDATPDDPAEQKLYDENQDAFTEACQSKFGSDYLVQFSTENTARDMDAIRSAMGDEQLNFVGISYGTFLGATYATLFPDRVRALYLDSAFDPAGEPALEALKTQLKGFEDAFANWREWCDTNESCDFKGTDVLGRWIALRDLLDATSLDTDGRVVNAATLEVATIASLYSRATWPLLAAALEKADAGDGSGLLELADSYMGREADGSLSVQKQASKVISCASGLGGETPADPQAAVDELLAIAPIFANGVAIEDLNEDCSALIGTQINPAPFRYSGDGPIVVLGGENDPATPFRWAPEMDASLGERSRLIRFTGEGHGQIGSAGCVDQIAASLIADLTLPDENQSCDPDEPAAVPTWWTEVVFPNEISPPIDLGGAESAFGIDPSQFYVEIRGSSVDTDATIAALETSLSEWDKRGEEDLPIGDGGDAKQVGFAKDANLIVVSILGPKSLADPSIAPIAGLLGDATSMVLVLVPVG
jgi:pimeloyl-ACP methyl ester carboxylesterase